MLKGHITAVLMPSVIIPKDRTIATVSPDSPEMAENANVSNQNIFFGKNNGSEGLIENPSLPFERFNRKRKAVSKLLRLLDY